MSSPVVVLPEDPDESVQLRSGVDFRDPEESPQPMRRVYTSEQISALAKLANAVQVYPAYSLGTTGTGRVCGYCREEYFGGHSCACGPSSLSNL